MSRGLPTIVDRLADYDRLLEVGIGNRTAIAAELADRGVAVIATDVVDRSVPEGVSFRREDVTDPRGSLQTEVEAIYALRLVPELQRPAARMAESLDVPLYYTTLGGDPAVLASEPLPVESGSLFRHRPGQHRSITRND